MLQRKKKNKGGVRGGIENQILNEDACGNNSATPRNNKSKNKSLEPFNLHFLSFLAQSYIKRSFSLFQCCYTCQRRYCCHLLPEKQAIRATVYSQLSIASGTRDFSQLNTNQAHLKIQIPHGFTDSCQTYSVYFSTHQTAPMSLTYGKPSK